MFPVKSTSFFRNLNGIDLLVLAASSPMLVDHFRGLWNSAPHQFFPLLLAYIVYAFYTRIGPELSNFNGQSELTDSLLVLIVRTLGLSLILLGALVDLPNSAAIGVIVYFFSRSFELPVTLRRDALGLCICSLLLLRLPGRYETMITQELQLLSSQLSSQLLDLFGVNHLLLGNQINSVGKTFFVDEACSGINSINSTVAIGLILGSMYRFSFFKTSLTILVAVLVCLFSNTTRIFLIPFLYTKYSIDLSHGPSHTLLGLLMFVPALVILIATTKAVSIPNSEDEETIASHSILKIDMRKRSSVKSMVVVVILGLSLVVWSTRYLMRAGNNYSNAMAVQLMDSLGKENATLLGTEVRHELIARNPTSPAGAFSQTYYLEKTDLDYVFSVDYPFFGDWHELSGCYRGNGWKILDRRTLDEDNSKSEGWSFVEIDMKDGLGKHASVIFGLCYVDGEFVSAPDTDNFLTAIWTEFHRRLWNGFSGEIIQFQLFHESDREIVDEVKKKLRNEFFDKRRTVYDRLFTESPALQERVKISK